MGRSAPGALDPRVDHQGVGTAQVHSALVGRASQTAVLSDAFAAAASGRTTVVLVGGEAGIGKSRLLSEFTASLGSSVRVVRGQCCDLAGQGIPYVAFVAALHHLAADAGVPWVARAAGPGSRELARLVPQLGPVPPESDLGRGRLFEAMATLLEHCAAERPTVLVLEDLHWAHASTRDLLTFLIRNLQECRLLMLLTFRDDDLHPGHPLQGLVADLLRHPRVQRIELPRLGRDDVAAMLTGLGGTPPEPHQLEAAVARSGGVPFFVEVIAQMGDTTSDLAPSLRDQLLVALPPLSACCTPVLRAASVAGSRIPPDQLAEVVSMPAGCDLDAAVRELVDRHVLVVGSQRAGYRFRHALLREAVASDLLPAESQRLHERWARCLEASTLGGEAVVEAAHHWFAAGALQQAFRSSVQAADTARTMYAFGEQLLLLERVLRLWDQVEPTDRCGADRVALLEGAADAAWRAGEPDRAGGLLAEAVDEVRQRGERDRYARLLVRQATYSRDYAGTDVLPLLDEALSQCPAGRPSALRAEILADVAVWHNMRGHVAQAADLGAQAVAEGERCGDERSTALALGVLGAARAEQGDVEQGLAMVERSRCISARLGFGAGQVMAFIRRSGILLASGRLEAAVEAGRAGRELARSLGDERQLGAFIVANEAEALLGLGRWDEALALLERTLAKRPPAPTAASLRVLRATVLTRRGTPAADTEVATVRGLVDEFDREPQQWIPALALRAEWATLHDRLDDVAAALAELGTREVSSESAQELLWPLLASIAAAVPALPELRSPLEQLVARTPRPAHQGEVDPWPTVVAAELDDDPRSWQRAVASLTAPGVEGPVYLRAYSQLRWAESLAAAGRPGDAARPLGSAAQTLRDLGADPLLARAIACARREHVPLPHGIGTPTRAQGPLGLTGRELEVLALVAAGRSNAEIAHDLVISTKTAAVHVSHILRKMGVSSRTQAAAVAFAQGLVGGTHEPRP